MRLTVLRALRAGALLLLAMAAAGCAATDNDPVPTLTIAPESQEVSAYNECMAGKGWEPSTTYEDGTYGFTFTDEQRSVFEVDNNACIDAIGANEPPDWSEAEWLTFYHSIVEQSACLEAEGVVGVPAPTFQAWMESDRAWGPYLGVPFEQISDRIEKLEQACPSPSG